LPTKIGSISLIITQTNHTKYTCCKNRWRSLRERMVCSIDAWFKFVKPLVLKYLTQNAIWWIEYRPRWF
jgi:hypothetical protein